LISSFCVAQNLNFTIDVVMNITETIIRGGDTFVLTMDYAINAEALAPLGGGGPWQDRGVFTDVSSACA
jgi:hypothetical protein